MKKLSLALTAFALIIAASGLSAREFGGHEGGYRNSPEFQNNVNAGGRPGTYKTDPAGRYGERGAYNAGYDQGLYNSGGAGTGTNVYIQQQPMGPQINPDQMPY